MQVHAEVLSRSPSFGMPPLFGMPLSDASEVFNIVGQLSYVALAAVALWGIYYVFLVLTRVNAKRFKSEALQDEFVSSI
jgi:hypothetical protein